MKQWLGSKRTAVQVASVEGCEKISETMQGANPCQSANKYEFGTGCEHKMG